MNIQEIKTAYFLGIGGIGMSALARYFKAIGISVHGYDRTRNDFTMQLEKEGFIIHYEEDIEAIPSSVISGRNSIAVYTPAIPPDHKELRYLLNKNVRLYKRSEVLGLISAGSFTIAVAGTHGKTTTSSMIAHLLNECGISFTAFLGGICTNFGSNYVHRNNGVSLFSQPVMVVEADEFDRSFLHLSPDIAIVTSTDPDHLDIYGSHDEVRESFSAFLGKLHEGGTAIVNEKAELKTTVNAIRYGSGEDCDARYSDILIRDHRFVFNYSFDGYQSEVRNALPGFHNVENATAAITACMLLKLPLHQVVKACAGFLGVKRRFEYVFDNGREVVIDDYAHHPSELMACIRSVKELYPGKKLTGVFQPHLFTRTRDFADGFAEALDMLDECWLLDIYPARELPLEGVNSEMLALKMKKNPVLMPKNNVLKHLTEERPELLLLLGAGDIDQLVKPIREIYEKAD